MSWPRSIAIALVPPVALLAGCAGSLATRDVPVGQHEASRDRGPAAGETRPLSALEAVAAEVNSANPARTANPAPVIPPPGNLETEAKLRDALNRLQREDPQRYAGFKQMLYEQDPSLPPGVAQILHDQCVAQLMGAYPSRADVSRAPVDVNAPPGAQNFAAGMPPVGQQTIATALLPPCPTPPQVSAPPPVMPGPVVQASAVQSVPASPPATNAAPVVASVSSSAPSDSSPPASVASNAEEPKPGQWQEQTRAAVESLEKELAREKLDDADRTRLSTVLRLLYLIENRRDKATEPIDALSDDEKEFWKQQLYGLSVSLDAEGKHAASRRAALALRYFDTAQSHLQNMSALDVHGLAFCSAVHSFGRYDELKPYDVKAGDQVVLYVEIDHFAAEQKGDQYETELQGEYEILDAQGVRVVNRELPLDKELCNNRRHDYFIAYLLRIPGECRPGKYTLRLTIEDLKGKKSNQSSIDFKVVR